MKKLFLTIITALVGFGVNGQNCSSPNPNFCTGNFFSNGDFETIRGNPDAIVDQDINIASGWSAPWGGGQSSLADLACSNSVLGSQLPVPNNGGVYAGMWIINSNNPAENATYREGMYNRLTTSITPNTGSYTFNFSMSNGMIVTNNQPVTIGIYGVYNPNNTVATAPTGLFTPSTLNLWPSASGVQIVKLGTITTTSSFTNTWVNQSVTFNSAIANFPANGITHILITCDDVASTSWNKQYVYFDNFCLTRTTLPTFSECDCIPQNLYNETITGSLFRPVIIGGDFLNYNYRLQFTNNAFSTFNAQNIAWNNWINTLYGFTGGNSNSVVHQFMLYEVLSNGTEIQVGNTFWLDAPNYNNSNEFTSILSNNKNYYIKHGVYYGQRNQGVSPLATNCPWKESRIYMYHESGNGTSPVMLFKSKSGALINKNQFEGILKLKKQK
jgi:hypothetical protein